uniref:Uncharacterized protein n=1 Tax=Trichuris muris TaxID=70415 RepID=A0A5S6Q9Z6_TRIMR
MLAVQRTSVDHRFSFANASSASASCYKEHFKCNTAVKALKAHVSGFCLSLLGFEFQFPYKHQWRLSLV